MEKELADRRAAFLKRKFLLIVVKFCKMHNYLVQILDWSAWHAAFWIYFVMWLAREEVISHWKERERVEQGNGGG